jgi:hypothetical protein
LLTEFTKPNKLTARPPLLGPLSISNSFVLDQFKVEKKTDFKFSTFPLLNLVVFKIRYSNEKIFALENWPTLGTKSGIFCFYINNCFLIKKSSCKEKKLSSNTIAINEESGIFEDNCQLWYVFKL